MMKLIRVPYGKDDVAPADREYKRNGVGSVGTIADWKANYRGRDFTVVDRDRTFTTSDNDFYGGVSI